LPNLTAWKGPVVVFGSVAAGETGGVSMVVNRRPTDGVTYGDFICIHGGGSLDGDINFDLILDSNWLDPNFWTEGWEPGVDPQNFQAKVNASSGRLHLELVMFARNASCSQPDSYNGPALLPGWQEVGGDSVHGMDFLIGVTGVARLAPIEQGPYAPLWIRPISFDKPRRLICSTPRSWCSMQGQTNPTSSPSY
jgi:hypothetical protein